MSTRLLTKISFDTNGKGVPLVYATNWGNLGTNSADFVIAKYVNGIGLGMGGQGDYLLLGAQGQDILFGGLGNNIIRGGAGADKLIGNGGNDTIHVSGGDGDIAIGGSGADTFVIKNLSTTNLEATLILDFKINEDFLSFEGAKKVTFDQNGSVVDTKGDYSQPDLYVTLDGSGNIIMNGAVTKPRKNSVH